MKFQTTTGYLSAVPMTKLGQFVAIVYGLVGIPLMVLAAVDIGRFLSDIVLQLYRKVMLFKFANSKICFKMIYLLTKFRRNPFPLKSAVSRIQIWP